MTRILHLIPRFITAGAERLVLEYAKRLPELGYEVAVASIRGGGELVAEFKKIEKKFNKIKKNYFQIVEVHGDNVSFIKRMRELKRFVGEWRPDIIHSHIFSADAAGYLLKREFDIPWVSTQHNGRQSVGRLRRLVLRRILRSADRVIAVSPAVAGDVEKYLRVDRVRIALITNGIDLEQACPHYTSPPSFASASAGRRAPSPKRRGGIELAIVGRLEEQKGHDILFRALTDLHDLPWELHIFGEGALRALLENLARELGINERVHWHGVVPDMSGALANIDCVVAPSRFEGMSLAVMEAMAAGRLVVASEAAGAGLIEQEKNGFIVPTEDVSALTKTLKYAIQEHHKLAGIGERAREYALEHFGIERHILQLVKLYGEIRKNFPSS